jgi:hypothetical protein
MLSDVRSRASIYIFIQRCEMEDNLPSENGRLSPNNEPELHQLFFELEESVNRLNSLHRYKYVMIHRRLESK